MFPCRSDALKKKKKKKNKKKKEKNEEKNEDVVELGHCSEVVTVGHILLWLAMARKYAPVLYCPVKLSVLFNLCVWILFQNASNQF